MMKPRKVAHDEKLRVTTSVSVLNSITSLNLNIFTVPEFKPKWESEYSIYKTEPTFLGLTCIIFAIYFITEIMMNFFIPEIDARVDINWIIIILAPDFICSTWNIAVAIMSFLPNYTKSVQRHFNTVCVISLISAYFTFVYDQAVVEIRSSLFGREHYPNLKWNISYGSSYPLRVCNDSDPAHTWTNPNWRNIGMSLGCENRILSPTTVSHYLLLTLCPIVLRLNFNVSVGLACNHFALLLAGIIVTGSRDSSVATAIAYQLAIGLIAAYSCGGRDCALRAQFALAKATRSAGARNRTLLHTLIPPNVVEHLGLGSGVEPGGAFVGQEVPACTVMFCMLDQGDRLYDFFTEYAFSLLDAMFSEFDDAVRACGMFKYQHVGEWYIVACPRAARPFDAQEQAAPYPDAHLASMLHLAQQLQAVTGRYTLPGAGQLRLKVGLSHGPTAGAVIGAHRRFYCLYGDTVNTAARMCKYAEAGAGAHCSVHFADMAERACPAVRRRPRGLVQIKGKGQVETCDLHLPEPEIVVPPPVRASEPEGVSAAAGPANLGSKARLTASSMRERQLSTAHLRPPAAHAAAAYAGEGIGNSGEEEEEHELGPEGRARLLDPAHRICGKWAVFTDPATERRFQASRAAERRRAAAIGTAAHLAAVGLQLHQVLHPEADPEFASFAGPAASELDSARSTARQVLVAHGSALLAAAAVGACLSFVLRRRGHGGVAEGSLALVLASLVHAVTSLAACTASPALRGWLAVFPLHALLWHGCLGAPSVLVSLAISVTAVAGLLGTAAAASAAGPPTFSLVAGALVAGLALPWHARVTSLAEREHWRLQRVWEAELEALSARLGDLLPPCIIGARILEAVAAAAAGEGNAAAVCERRRAAVLQLDLVGFTAYSEGQTPLALARTIHALFARFDIAVAARGLFKMDTIGDAYVALAFLPADNSMECDGVAATAAAADAAACEALLAAAGEMLAAAASLRAEAGGAGPECRIGVAVGPVVAGVLGRLQPRYHVFGEGLRAAERHEQTGTPGAVHASAAFASTVATASSLRRIAAQPAPEGPQLPQYAGGSWKDGNGLAWTRVLQDDPNGLLTGLSPFLPVPAEPHLGTCRWEDGSEGITEAVTLYPVPAVRTHAKGPAGVGEDDLVPCCREGCS